MSQKEKYIAITFGPITRVISYAQHTKELWAASYLFSYLAKQVVEPFKKRTFLLPQLADEMYDKTKTRGAGLFPDRYIFKAKDQDDFGILCNTCDKLYEQLGIDIAKTIKKTKEAGIITEYLKRTIKIYCFEKEFSSNENIVSRCENILEAMELQDLFPSEEPCNYLSLFFEQVNGSFLTKDAFEEGAARIFSSIIEYAAVELNSDEYWNPLTEEKEKSLKPYHKYIAFVKADGDHLTQTIKGLKEQGKDVSELDKCLLKYNLNIIQLIEEYQGKAIFLGGDDLLFFAPIRNGGKNIFTLLQEIDAAFNSAMKELPTPPTLSFGLSISYYKHPMFEAIEHAEELLKQAKDAGRNSIAWYFRKHSGQVCQSIINKGYTEVYDQCIRLTSNGMTNENNSEKLLNSFTYWLVENKDIILHILEPLKSDSSNKEEEVIKKVLINYFNNSFNEPLHEKMRDYIETLVQYLVSAQKAVNGTITKKDQLKDYAIDSLGSILRFINFLKSEKP